MPTITLESLATQRMHAYMHGRKEKPFECLFCNHSQHVDHFPTFADGLPFLPHEGFHRLDDSGLARLEDHFAAFGVEEGAEFVRAGGLGGDVILWVHLVSRSILKGGNWVVFEDYTGLAPSYLIGSTSSSFSSELWREFLAYF